MNVRDLYRGSEVTNSRRTFLKLVNDMTFKRLGSRVRRSFGTFHFDTARHIPGPSTFSRTVTAERTLDTVIADWPNVKGNCAHEDFAEF